MFCDVLLRHLDTMMRTQDIAPLSVIMLCLVVTWMLKMTMIQPFGTNGKIMVTIYTRQSFDLHG